MGYTHYWERPRVLPPRLFAVAVEECHRLCDALNIPLGGESGEGKPIFSRDEICFNGHVESGWLTAVQQVEGLVWPKPGAKGIATADHEPAVAGGWGNGPAVTARVLGPDGNGSYETFRVERVREPRSPLERPLNGKWFGYCKTNYRPYDLCVQGCLIVLNHHLGSRCFAVTSDGGSRGWNDARDACQHVLGYGVDWGEGELGPALAKA